MRGIGEVVQPPFSLTGGGLHCIQSNHIRVKAEPRPNFFQNYLWPYFSIYVVAEHYGVLPIYERTDTLRRLVASWKEVLEYLS